MSDRTPNDLLLMGRIAARDSTAFRELFDEYSPMVLGVLVRMLGDSALAEEVLQEAFLQVWEQADRFRPERASPRGWLLLIARSRALDRLRSDRSRREREIVATRESVTSHEAPEGTRNLEKRERQRAVGGALEGLPEEQRHCIELAFFKGLTQREISDVLKEPLGTVKSRISLGMSKLRRSLAEAR